MYPDVQLLIDGVWRGASNGAKLSVVNPASGDVNGTVAHATRDDLDQALEWATKFSTNFL